LQLSVTPDRLQETKNDTSAAEAQARIDLAAAPGSAVGHGFN
jgi:hypothetical protein